MWLINIPQGRDMCYLLVKQWRHRVRLTELDVLWPVYLCHTKHTVSTTSSSAMFKVYLRVCLIIVVC